MSGARNIDVLWVVEIYDDEAKEWGCTVDVALTRDEARIKAKREQWQTHPTRVRRYAAVETK